jgi:hypothetical protein
VLGPAPSVRAALDLLETETTDVALLDENLAGVSVVPVAEVLTRRNITFAVVSGFARSLSALKEAPRLGKPVTDAMIRDMVLRLRRPSRAARPRDS